MYPNLLGQKEFFRLTEQDMGEIIGVSRSDYNRKVSNGSFIRASAGHIADILISPLISYLLRKERSATF